MQTAETTINSDTVNLSDLRPGYFKFSTDSTADFQSILSPSSKHLGSFFTSHQLKVKHIQPVQFNQYQPDWILGLLLLCFIVVAWVQVYYRRRLRQILMAPFSKRFLNQLIRDGDLFSERISLAMGLIYVISISLFLYELTESVNVSSSLKLSQGYTLFLVMCIFLLVYWLIKIVAMRFLSFIFKTRQTSKEYILNILIFNILTGIFFLPFLVFAIYLKCVIFLWVCTIIFCLFFLFRLIRGFLIGISITKFSYLFLFVYLCSLELLPLIVLLKIVLKYYL